MTTLVVGASGATGKQLVEQLLLMGQNVKVIVRPLTKTHDTWNNNDKISIIRADISEITVDEMANYIKDCQSVASCLGHNLTLKGIFGKPRKLVTNAVKLLCTAITKNSPEKTVKFVLMNTVGNRNRDLNEPISVGQKLVMGVIRLIVPPQSDNEKAADFLRLSIGQKNTFIRWVAVRPDTLLNEDSVTEYELYTSPIRSALFNPGKTSRINVGHFMAKLITENNLWEKWEGKMPVIYNKAN
ncbi:MAG: NAD-dependent epimerase [Bacteroidetes bacterium GWF2_42_66]|nr:MAG: NAD-dependent epimerase [Bacteroidetes bacterium GWA2_42_15]OFX99999.1 MAG: NAD-dependent epimerase [Bacteroidetes bacterium GWE2_42_39]OFY40185.1 MAG: NAD-dependent epimerase [Bacteroidetes bacterium GWF2_42_66]HBL74014.1 NAD-dependent epimerase [Prolixibacteraceae bacterium]HCR89566.1 NAD-dependent epimerase [Prolixibacteraceae bacterium]